ncbi:MAG: glutamate-cysteine ligase family protein [Salinisphaeraceae bacterium]|nr:glutamate-cysteine ligase family protein [Salinisphaeraceae bacterium]
MGREIDRWRFSESDYAAFKQRLTQETAQLGEWFADDRFVDAPLTIGYELEACLVDEDGMPGDANERFLSRLDMPEVVPELARSNIEFNGHPHVLSGDGLRRMHAELDAWLERAREVARGLGLQIVMIGIPPTLPESDLSLAHITQSNRYRAINHSLAQLRGKPGVTLAIHGQDDYRGEFDSIMPESAATSFQLHLRLPKQQATRWFNAALVASAPALAIGVNSPWLFGHDLWAETRIPVFAQAVDTGSVHYVSFGQRFVQDSLFEVFQENLRDYPPLLPIEIDEAYAHLQLHNGTIWRWNRVILDPKPADAHLRLEHRSLPSGPSVIDMVANAAFFWGLTRGLAETALPIDFDQARSNFYQAARHGMAAEMHWGSKQLVTALVLEQLLPIARSGLERLQVDSGDIQEYLAIIEARVRAERTGAGWQRAWVARHGPDLQALLKTYMQQQWSGMPVSEWPL